MAIIEISNIAIYNISGIGYDLSDKLIQENVTRLIEKCLLSHNIIADIKVEN